jgi:hypothetical protein
MRKTLGSLVLAIPLVAFLPQSASAQSYGLGQQVLVIGPSEFQPFTSGQQYSTAADHYVYAGELDTFRAPLRLPDGALITQMCYYAFDSNGSGSNAAIYAVKLPAGGQPSGAIQIAFVAESFNIDYGTVCTSPAPYTFHTDADLDGMGIAHLAHEVDVTAAANVGIGGVRIIWQRQVSPAPGSATFNDVPTTDPAFQHIEALVASGITAGCGGGNYCPDASLTRRQMAVFLAKALGLHWAE